jgi:hypothetical protein
MCSWGSGCFHMMMLANLPKALRVGVAIWRFVVVSLGPHCLPTARLLVDQAIWPQRKWSLMIASSRKWVNWKAWLSSH